MEENNVCDFCLRSQSEVLIMFSSKNNKFHICDYCLENMYCEMMNYFRNLKKPDDRN